MDAENSTRFNDLLLSTFNESRDSNIIVSLFVVSANQF